MKRLILAILSMTLAMSGARVLAQESGHGESGGSGCGDLFGDLVEIKRVPLTGQPILEKRWILGPMDTPEYAYCPIAITATGAEIPFLAPSPEDALAYPGIQTCDLAADAPIVPVDYFGRLSGGRTKERNIRMHLDEVISNIKMPTTHWVTRDVGGRLMLGSDCTPDADGKPTLTGCTWKVVDSPQENVAVYQRILKYGHLQTDPREIDTSFHGDPALYPQYHPALTLADYAKFMDPVTALLPENITLDGIEVEGSESAESCFAELAGLAAEQPWSCAQPKPITRVDFVLATGALAGAADKTGKVTVDLVQYLNRIVKITARTDLSAATLRTLPARIRDCSTSPCVESDGDATLPFPANERFLDFARAGYKRTTWFNSTAPILKPSGAPGTFVYDPAVAIMPFLESKNPGLGEGANIDAFVKAANDGLRTVEFIHNYKVPVDLGYTFP